MKSTGRILTTHVGSLVRPPELVAFLKRQQNGEPYDAGAYEECLRRSVADVVKGQAEAGIDIVSDGEFGKSISWSRYVLERLSGFEERQDDTGASGPRSPARTARTSPSSTTNTRRRRASSAWARTPPSSGTWVITGPDRLYRPAGAAARHRQPEGGDAGRPASSTASCRWWRRRASCRRARTSTIATRRRRCSRSPTRCARNTRRSSMPA